VTGPSIPQALRARIAALRDLGQTIYAARPDLQATFSDPTGAPYWTWLQTHGCAEYPRVRELSLPVPPQEIAQLVNTGGAWAFVLNGASAYRMFDRIARECGAELAAIGPILDFGCGPGRVLRMMLRHADTLRVVGTDVNREAIEWCRANFPYGEFHVNAKNPPTSLPASEFGFIYANSVFSHLAEEPHLGWLRELRRLARPGALLVLTVHGPHALRRGKDQAELRTGILEVRPEELRDAEVALEARGFVFIRQPEGHLDRDQFGISFVTEDYVRRVWAKEFEVVDYQPGALDDWQDAVVLRRPA
jgi:SAM-dependent methyltransferase